ncbi:hypothetical protein EGW08_001172, partial [Elysia chlorotica]
MSRRRSPAAAVGAAKASWDIVGSPDDHHGNGSDVTADQNATPAPDIFKQRRAIGRHTVLRTSAAAPRRTNDDLTNCEGKVAATRKIRGPPTLLDRPRSSTGFEDYFSDADASARLRLLKANSTLQNLKQMAKKNLNTGSNEIRNMSSHKNENLKIEHSEGTLVGSERKTHERSLHRTGHRERLCHNEDNDLCRGEYTDKVKAFRALVGPAFDTLKDGPSQRDISNEQLKRARSVSSVVDEVGKYLKFSSQSSGKGDMPFSTHLDNEIYLENEQSLKTPIQRIQGDEKDIIQRHDLPSSFTKSIREMVDQRSKFGASSKSFQDELDERRNVFSEDDSLGCSKQIVSGSYFQNYAFRYNDGKTGKENSGDTPLKVHRKREDTKRVMRRPSQSGEERAREREGDKHSDTVSERRGNHYLFEQDANAFLADNVRATLSNDTELVDKEVFEYIDQASETRRRHQNSRLHQNRAQSTHSVDVERSHYREFGARPSSSQEVIYRSSASISRGSQARPLTATGLSERSTEQIGSKYASTASSAISAKDAGLTSSNVGPIAKRNERRMAHAEVVDGIPEKDASLKVHLNFLGASLTNLSSRLTSSSESDLRSHTNERPGGAGDFSASLKQGSKSASAVSGTGRAAETLSRDSPTAMSRRQSGSACVASPFDIAHVKISVGEDGLSLQTWASSSSLVLGSASEAAANREARGRHHVAHSSLSIAHSDKSSVGDTSSCRIGSTLDGKQTNVHVASKDGSFLSRTSSSVPNSPRDILLLDSATRHINYTKQKESFRTDSDYRSLEKPSKNVSKRLKDSQTDSKAFSSNYQDIEVSDTLESTYQNSQNSLEDTLVTDGATNGHRSKETNRSITKIHADSRGTQDRPERSRIISRKNPLKALHPSSPDSPDLKIGDTDHGLAINKRFNSQNRLVSPETNERTKEKHILVKRPTKGRVDQTSQKQSSDVKSPRLNSLKLSVRNLGASRSKSSLELFSGGGPEFDSPLPSKTKMKEITEKLRPQTSLAISANPNKKDITQYTKSTKSASEKDDNSKSRGALLKQKVQKLHEDITRRLQSRENSSFSINSSYDQRQSHEDTPRQHRKMSNVDHGSGESDSCISDASTIQKVGTPDANGLPQSPRLVHRRRSPGLHSNISSPLSSPKPGFATSTPVKSARPSYTNDASESETEVKRRLLRQVAAELGKEKLNSEVEKEMDTAQKFNYGRFTPDVTDRISSLRRSAKLKQLLKTRSRDEDSSSDDEVDRPKEANHAQSSRFGLRRSESTGSLLKVKVKGKEDFMGRILDKMSGLSGGTRQLDQAIGYVAQPIRRSGGSREMKPDLDNRVSGRASPADMLLGHLDNPQMVKLLQRLYKADPDTRKALMVKFQYFKTWEYYAKDTKEKRIRKEEL